MNNFAVEKEKAKEKMSEAMLEYAGACHVENIANEMETEEETGKSISFPAELDARIRKLISYYNAKRKLGSIWKTTVKIFPKAAIFLFAVLASFSILLTSVEAFRVKVFNFIIQIGREYTSIDLKENTLTDKETVLENDPHKIPSEWEDVYIPTYAPEGFKIAKTESLTVSKIIYYSDTSNELIVFTQYTGEKTNLRIDTENAIIHKISINEQEGLLVEKNGRITIAWHNNDSSFSLTAKIDKNELIKMAESVKIKK